MKDKVAVVKCNSYEKTAVAEAAGKIFALCGIREDAFRKILFKPNMLSARTPEEGVTTHPAVVEAAARYFKNSEKIIGDSPANINKPAELYWDKCGYKKVSEDSGAPLVKFSNSFMLDILPLFPSPRRGESQDEGDKGKNIDIPVTNYLKEFSLVNIAKLKTHGLTILTAAVKNLYGLIPGFRKSVLHSIFVSPLHFSEFIAVYYYAVKDYVSFNIVDAIVSMEGSGPAAGKLRETGYLIGGANAIAVDIACCKLIGIRPENIPYLKIYGERYGLPEIELVGDELVPVKNFDIPGRRAGAAISSKAFRPFLSLLGKRFKAFPVIDDNLCKKCYACKQVCPVKAISKDLKFDRKKCINCLCCFEVCPYKAISVKKSFIAKLFT